MYKHRSIQHNKQRFDPILTYHLCITPVDKGYNVILYYKIEKKQLHEEIIRVNLK